MMARSKESAAMELGPLNSSLLERYLDEQVQVPQTDMSGTAAWVKELVQLIRRLVKREDGRFGGDWQSSGSYSEHLKVHNADEFDFMVSMVGTEELVGSPPVSQRATESTVQVWCLGNSPWNMRENPRPEDENLQRLLEADIPGWFSHQLVWGFVPAVVPVYPRTVMNVFMGLVKSAYDSILTYSAQCPSLAGHSSPFKVDIKIHRLGPNSPAVTLTLKKGDEKVDVDLVPCIRNMPREVTWPSRWQQGRWPPPDKMHEIESCGVDLVAKKEWRISFSRADHVLMTGIDADGGRRRDSLKILKNIYQDKWQSSNVLCSYYLKNVLFWACEEHPDGEAWKNLAISFRRLVEFLLFFLENEKLPLYFMSSVNLLEKQKGKLGGLVNEVRKLRNDLFLFRAPE